MEFSNNVAVITGGAHGIGKAIAEAFAKEGATVRLIDIQPNPDFQGDISDEAVLRAFAERVISECGHVDYLINNAPPPSKGIDSCSYDEFNRALRIGVTAPFNLSQLFLPLFS